MKRILFIVLDGLGDQPQASLGNKTPLEAAETPQLDYLARMGRLGMVYPVGKGIAPESDIAVISLLGYDAHKYYTGRGPLEAFAEGLAIKDGDLALRVNFATVAPDGKTIKDRRVGRNLTTQEATALAREINSKVALQGATFEFKNTIGHRGVLVIRGRQRRLSGWISNTDPAYDREGVFGVAKEKFENVVQEAVPCPGYEQDPAALAAAASLNEFTKRSMEVLNASLVNTRRIGEGKLPGNLILARDAGDSLPKFPSIKDLFKLKFGSFVQMPVERGIALLTGIQVIEVPQSSGKAAEDYILWARLARENMEKFDGLYIHIKGPDEPGHDGDVQKKKESIEIIDKHFFLNLIPKIDLDDTIIAVTADHSTPCNLKAHSADPVPLLLTGGGIESGSSKAFSEKEAAAGSLGEFLGREVLSLLIKLARVK